MDNSNSNSARVLLTGVEVSEEAPVYVKVNLKLGENLRYGDKEGEKKDILLLIGQATIEALNKLLPRPLDAKLDYVEAVNPKKENSPQTALSLIRFKEQQKESFLNGSCPIGNSIYEAAAKSVLDALNRKIESELQRAVLRSRTGQLPPSSDMMALINSNTPLPPKTDPIAKIEEPIAKTEEPKQQENTNSFNNKDEDVITTALTLERVTSLSAQAHSASMKGNYEQAIFYYQQAIECDDTNASYHYELGLALTKLPNKDKEAIAALKRATELDPNEATYAKELENVLRGEQLAELQEETPITTISSRKEAPKSLWQVSVNPKIAIIIGAVIIILGAIPIILFFLNTSRTVDPLSSTESEMGPLKIIYESSSAEPGKTVKAKADEIIKNNNLGNNSNDFWSMSKDKNGKITTSFSYLGKDKKVKTATWVIDIQKGFALATNPEAEEISGKIKH